MEGGIAILLLLVLVALVGGFLVFFTSLGGALSLRRRSEGDASASGGRPEHTRPTTPYHEHTTVAGTEDEAQRGEEQRR